MNDRRLSFQGATPRGGTSTRADARTRRILPGRVLALLGAAVLASATLGSCRAGSNGNGTFFVSFAPDMTITASGLEEALRRMEDLFRDCLAGTWLRPCTPEEEAEIERIHDKVVQAKQHLIAN